MNELKSFVSRIPRVLLWGLPVLAVAGIFAVLHPSWVVHSAVDFYAVEINHQPSHLRFICDWKSGHDDVTIKRATLTSAREAWDSCSGDCGNLAMVPYYDGRTLRGGCKGHIQITDSQYKLWDECTADKLFEHAPLTIDRSTLAFTALFTIDGGRTRQGRCHDVLDN
jgi:hypothetical protein